MEIYKFQDVVDGNFAFVMAKSQIDATEKLLSLTSVPFKFIESKKPEELKGPIVLMNAMLPF